MMHPHFDGGAFADHGVEVVQCYTETQQVPDSQSTLPHSAA